MTPSCTPNSPAPRPRAALARMRQAQYDYEPERVRTSLQQLFAQQAVVQLYRALGGGAAESSASNT